MSIENIFSTEFQRIALIGSYKCFIDATQFDYIVPIFNGSTDIFKSNGKKVFDILKIFIQKLFLYKELNFRCRGRGGYFRFGGCCRYCVSFQKGDLKEILEIVFILESWIVGGTGELFELLFFRVERYGNIRKNMFFSKNIVIGNIGENVILFPELEIKYIPQYVHLNFIKTVFLKIIGYLKTGNIEVIEIS